MKKIWAVVIFLSVLAALNLVISGQSWGIVYGLGLWGAKILYFFDPALLSGAYWEIPDNLNRVKSSVLTDTTSLTNLGLMFGAFLIAWGSGKMDFKKLKPVEILLAIVCGFFLGYSSRLAFGCNIGAYLSGISTGSLHGWIWLPAAFLGSIPGVYARKYLMTRFGR